MDTLKSHESRSKTRSKSKTMSKTKSNSRPKSKSKSKTKSKSKSKTMSKSKSKTMSKSKSGTPEDILIKIPSSSSSSSSSSSHKEEVELKFPDPLPIVDYDEKIAKKIERTFKMHNKLEPFLGDVFFQNIFYLYLFNKYKMGCIPTEMNRHKIGIRILISDNPKYDDSIGFQNRNLVSELYKCIINENPTTCINVQTNPAKIFNNT